MSIFLPNTEQVIELHRRIVTCTGGSAELRSQALLESALARGQAGFDGHELYPSVEEKAAAIGCGLIQNHAFVDGNKRIGVMVMLLILRMNHLPIQYEQTELIEIGLSTASGTTDVINMVHWIREHKA